MLTVTKREFRLENEYRYNRAGPVRWIISHMLRYPLFPVAAILMAVVNNYAFSYRQMLVGKGFDLILTPGWRMAALLRLVLLTVAYAVAQGLTGLLRNFSVEFTAQLIERNARDELYVSLLGKSQTFHGRQRIGDIMARATSDVRSLNYMFSPGLMLITDSLMAIAVPVVMIGLLDLRLLLVPLLFVVLWALTVYDYNRRLKPVTMGQREWFGKMNAGLAESVGGIEVVKANAQEQSEWLKFARNARQVRDYVVQEGVIQARYWPMLVFLVCWALGFLHASMAWRQPNTRPGCRICGLAGDTALPYLHLDLRFQPGADGRRWC